MLLPIIIIIIIIIIVVIIIIIIIIIITFKKLFFLELNVLQWVCGPITFLLLINFAVFDGSYHRRMLRYCFKTVENCTS